MTINDQDLIKKKLYEIVNKELLDVGNVVKKTVYGPVITHEVKNRIVEAIINSECEISIRCSSQSVHKTLDSVNFQESLSLSMRISTALVALFGSKEDGKVWLNTPNPDLDNIQPLELIEQGQGEIVARLLEDSLLGHPG